MRKKIKRTYYKDYLGGGYAERLNHRLYYEDLGSEDINDIIARDYPFLSSRQRKAMVSDIISI